MQRFERSKVPLQFSATNSAVRLERSGLSSSRSARASSHRHSSTERPINLDLEVLTHLLAHRLLQ